ncbi:Regulation of nuclear pre-mRNA domain-containing protein 1B [Phytophthora cinnamomi]|uniref:Regulation of nuclear pre-mRNA domain-containing protein 1B n=1 Tax=Phytophthora cinnamomi TaxID=4785 RepID=UPI00355A367A|nr:Regulation of nuclear pre-mRNA domain-containing protein 1B [Phytophthora cinnamomi]
MALDLGSNDQYALTLLGGNGSDDQYDGPSNGGSSSLASRPYSKTSSGADNEQMRTEIVRLENVLASRIAARANQDKSNLPLERSSKIEKYVEVMELTKCLRRQKEFLLSENRKRQRFAEKIQQAMPPSTDSIQFMKNVKYPPDEELEKTSREAFMEMMEYQVSGEAATYMGWQTKRESKSMYMHTFSEKSFVGEDMARVFNETWAMFHDEAKQELLHRRRSKFCILKKLNDNMYLTRNIHQFIGESFPRHAMTLVCRISIDKDTFAIISKSVVPPTNDAQHLVWTDECFMWKFSRRVDAQSGFDISIRGKYGSTSAVAGNRLPMLESYFQLVDWESLVLHPMFDFTAA